MFTRRILGRTGQRVKRRPFREMHPFECTLLPTANVTAVAKIEN